MADLFEIEAYCDSLLEASRFSDYCPNGIQVEGRAEVSRLVGGVTACQALVDAAVEAGADLLLVHHGWFWKGEPAPLRGLKGRRAAALMGNGIGLLAYHLPLDAHPELGNNRRLGEALGLLDASPSEAGEGLVWQGRLPRPLPLDAFAEQVAQRLGHEPLVIPGHGRPLTRIAWCSGAAQGYIEQAAALGVDAFLSGEVSEQTTHLARELGIHYLAAGHHATERGGVEALGAHLAVRFGLEWRFIDIPNPV